MSVTIYFNVMYFNMFNKIQRCIFLLNYMPSRVCIQLNLDHCQRGYVLATFVCQSVCLFISVCSGFLVKCFVIRVWQNEEGFSFSKIFRSYSRYQKYSNF